MAYKNIINIKVELECPIFLVFRKYFYAQLLMEKEYYRKLNNLCTIIRKLVEIICEMYIIRLGKMVIKNNKILKNMLNILGYLAYLRR